MAFGRNDSPIMKTPRRTANMLLKDLTERLGRGRRSVSVTGVDVGEGGIERSVSEVLTDQEGISTLLDHQHRRCVL